MTRSAGASFVGSEVRVLDGMCNVIIMMLDGGSRLPMATETTEEMELSVCSRLRQSVGCYSRDV